jgi:fructosamine-3-kinase
VTRAVEATLETSAGHAVRVMEARPIAGGCINAGSRLRTDRGDVFFLKWNPSAPPGMFEAEADGLAALRAAARGHGARVPEVVAVGGGSGEPGWLLMEYVEPGRGGRGYGRSLGRALAGLHAGDPPAVSRASTERATGTPSAERDGGVGKPAKFGWHRDNFIGSLPQANSPAREWAVFWRDARLAPQLSLAPGHARLSGNDARLLDRLLARVEDALAGVEDASLLHGDLWSGNVYPSAAGEPVLIDPAVYLGDREVDLAMSELFGGFPSGFLEAYREAAPLDSAYEQLRRPLYQLYYLLVHVNLFGESYLSGVRSAAERVLRSL